MSNIKLDLKHFKHVGSDDKSTTLQHKDGHTITLAHKALSEPSQKQLAALASMSKDSQKPQDRSQAVQEQQARDPNSAPSRTMQAPQAFNLGGDVMDYLDNFAKKRYDAMEGDTKSTMPTPKVDPAKVKKYNIQQDPPEQTTPVPAPEQKAEGGMTGRKMYAEPQNQVVSQEDKAPVASSDPIQSKPKTPYAEDTTFNPMKLQDPQAEDKATNALYNKHYTALKGYFPELSEDELQAKAAKSAMQEKKQDAYHQENNSADAEWQKYEGANQIKSDMDAETASKQAAAKSKAALGLNPAVPQVNPPIVPAASVTSTPAVPDAALPKADPPASLAPKAKPAAGSALGDVDISDPMQKAFTQEKLGEEQKYKAMKDLGANEANAANEAAKNLTAMVATHAQTQKDMLQERQAHIQDIKDGYIDPEQYWKGDKNGNGSHSKIAAGIGMILAGFNPAGGANQAVDFLQKQIDRNIDAQKTNLATKNNLLAENTKQYKNINDAELMTRMMYNDVLTYKMQKAAASAKGPLQEAAMNSAIGAISERQAPLERKFQIQNTIYKLATDPTGSNNGAIKAAIGQLNAIGDPMGKEMGDRFDNFLGYSPTTVISKDARQKAEDIVGLQGKAKDLLDWTEKHNTWFGGEYNKDYNVGRAKVVELQSSIRSSLLGTVYKPGEQPLLDVFADTNPAGALKMLQTQPKLRELIESSQRHLDVMRRGLDINPSTAGQKQPSTSSGPEVQVGTIIRNPTTGETRQKTATGWTKI